MSSPGENLAVGSYEIPSAELEWDFGTSGGPGGQHANRSNTRAELRFDLAATGAFPDEVKAAMIDRLGDRLIDGAVLAVSSAESRSQWRNRAIARRKLAEILETAMRRPARRRPSRPTTAARRRRLEEKRRRAELKRLRRPPEPP